MEFGAPGVVPGLPGVAGVAGRGDPGCAVLVPETPVAGGVVVAPGPVPGAHGTAVPLVPTDPGAAPGVPVLRAVVLTDPLLAAPVLGTLPGVVAVPCAAAVPLPDADAVAAGAPDCERGPASVAVLTLPFGPVVVPVELFT